jgi:hypothetical protein
LRFRPFSSLGIVVPLPTFIRSLALGLLVRVAGDRVRAALPPLVQMSFRRVQPA